LLPSITHSCPTASARVLSEAASEPAPGSVRQYEASFSPRVSSGPQCSRTAGVAQVPSIQVAMLWMVMKAVVEGSTAAISSNTSVASSRGRPRPPAFSGAYRPQKPSSPALAMASRGKIPSASQRAACGASSAWANCRAVSAKAR